MRRAREEEGKEGVDDEDEDAIITYPFPIKKLRKHKLPPLVFAVIDHNNSIDVYYFDSQNVVKRQNVLDTITRLSKQTHRGPIATSWLLDWVTGNLGEDDEGNLEEAPPAYRDDVVAAYMRLNPQPGEWSSRLDQVTIRAKPGASITMIRAHP